MDRKNLLVKNLNIDSFIDANLNNKDEHCNIFKNLCLKFFGHKKIIENSTNVKEELPDNTIRYEPDLKIGLTDEQINERISNSLTNKDSDDNSRTYFQIFYKNIFTFFNVLEFIIFVLLLICHHAVQTAFFFVVIINTFIGIHQEIKSKKTIEKLKLISKQNVNVLRNGKKLSVIADDIVLDDLYILSSGDQIPTDAILKSGQLEVNESLLTGESLPIKKEVGDLILAGSFVVSGNALVKADKVSKYNYASGIQSKAKAYSEKKSELTKSLNLIIKVVSLIIIPLAIALFITQWNKYCDNPAKYGLEFNGVYNPQFYYEVFCLDVSKTAGSLVGMIPSGIYLLTSIALAVSAVNLSKKNTLVQDLYCIEMLARVNVLCLDKTGTLTDGSMKVNEVVQLDNNYDITTLMGSFLSGFEDSNQTSLALKNHFSLNNVYSVKTTLPFSSKRKLSAITFNEIGTFILGAPEYVYPNYQNDEKLYTFIKNAQNEGLRVILFAKCSKDIENGDLPNSYEVTPVSVFSLEDHIREEAPNTINWFINNDVDIKIISGDDPLTVSIIARKCSVPNTHKYISLKDKDPEEVKKLVSEYTIFGRVSPEQKALIIETLKHNGKTVGMTGDGVNDILAMKSSDCSIAMANGSNAARNVANLVLLDSNFASLPAVVKEGRKVVNNISRSSSLFLMKTLFVASFTLLCCICTPFQYPFSTNNILTFEVLGIGIPSLFLSLQPNTQIIKGNFIKKTFSKAIPSALCLLIAILINYILKYSNVLHPINIEGVSDNTLSIINSYSFTTFNVFTMNIIALIMVFERCRPFNRYRRNLYIGLCVCAILTMFVSPFIPIFKTGKNLDTFEEMTSALNFQTYNLSTKITGIDFRFITLYMWIVLIVHIVLCPILYYFLCKIFAKMDDESVKK